MALICVWTLLTLLSRAGVEPAVTPRDAMVVSNAWLQQHLGDKDLRILHVSHAHLGAEFAQAHIPGARYVDLEQLSTQAGGLSLEMPAADELRRRLQALGISDRSRVVVYYPHDDFLTATRVIQTLNYAGLGAQTMLLENGFDKWKREGRPTESGASAATVGVLAELQVQPVVVAADFVRAHINTPGYVIVDARDGAYYDGVSALESKRGHIPGAVSLANSKIYNDEYSLKSSAELTTLFSAAGIKAGDRLIVYCHIGQQATAVVFAARTLGFDAVLYDGSMQDWARQPNAPTTVAK